MNDAAQCIDLLKQKAKLVAMIAPSFPIVYEYPQIVTRLKALGFEYVLEVTAGAKRTNEAVIDFFKNNPEGRVIASPCAGFVRLIRKSYPHMQQYLGLKIDSPMVATARIAREKYPEYQPVFIGPCLAKKLESSEDYPDLKIIVLTYKELDKIFEEFKIGDCRDLPPAKFDLAEASTRLYPADGGLTNSSGLKQLLKEDEIRIVSGWKNIPGAVDEFQKNPKIRFLDILFCDGGCISGPGIVSKLTVEERKKKILDFKQAFSV
jgi:iron only hydrogenase large subunit-like protein